MQLIDGIYCNEQRPSLIPDPYITQIGQGSQVIQRTQVHSDVLLKIQECV
jgi:hypothetical protein